MSDEPDDIESDDPELQETLQQLQEMMESDDEELKEELEQVINTMYDAVITGKPEEPTITEMLTRLHKFLMKRGGDLPED